jgi:triosephosphate isomerase
VPLARSAGATAALVGHSERRHVFGETDQETGKKVRALLSAGMVPVLCVGETLEAAGTGRRGGGEPAARRRNRGLEPESSTS